MNELSDLFKLVAEEKRKKKEEFDSIIGELNLDPVFKQVSKLKGKSKKIKIKDEQPDDFGNVSNITPIPFQESKQSENKNILVEKSLGLLSEPTNVKQILDPLTPIDKKVEDLEKQYKLFLSRIQQQLSTLGGGGETNLAYMDMPIKYITSSTYTVTPQDYYIGVNYAGAVSITLPTPKKNGKTYIIKDELGEASRGVNRYITILPAGSDTIDNRDRAFIAYDYGSLTFVYRNGWRVV